MKYVISEAWVWVECWGLECYLIKCVWQDCHIPLSHAFSALQYIFLVLILVKSTKVNGIWYFKFTRAPLKSMSSSYFQRHCAKKLLGAQMNFCQVFHLSSQRDLLRRFSFLIKKRFLLTLQIYLGKKKSISGFVRFCFENFDQTPF